MAGGTVSAALGAFPDLEAMAEAEQEAEYVLVLMPPFLCESLWRRLTEPSYWELLTAAGFWAGLPCRDDWRTPDSRRWTEEALAGWVRSKVGFPVALEADAIAVTPVRPGARERWVPLFWVRRNS